MALAGGRDLYVSGKGADEARHRSQSHRAAVIPDTHSSAPSWRLPGRGRKYRKRGPTVRRETAPTRDLRRRKRPQTSENGGTGLPTPGPPTEAPISGSHTRGADSHDRGGSHGALARTTPESVREVPLRSCHHRSIRRSLSSWSCSAFSSAPMPAVYAADLRSANRSTMSEAVRLPTRRSPRAR